MPFPERLAERLPIVLQKMLGGGRSVLDNKPKIDYGEIFSRIGKKSDNKPQQEIIRRNYIDLKPTTTDELKQILQAAGIDLSLWGDGIDQLLSEIKNGDCSLQQLQSGRKSLNRFTYRLEIRRPGFENITHTTKANSSDAELVQKAREIALENSDNSAGLNQIQIEKRAFGSDARYVDANYPGLDNQWYFYMFDVIP